MARLAGDDQLQGLALSRTHQAGAEARALLVLDDSGGRDSGTALFQEHWGRASASAPVARAVGATGLGRGGRPLPDAGAGPAGAAGT
jgi:hypothetical protein